MIVFWLVFSGLQVGSADALAFFLPGVVSQFSKVLYVSKTMISGAAGSVEAMDQAIRGLAEFLMVVLQDDVNLSGLDNVTAGFHASKDESTQSFLEELRQLPIKSRGKSETIAEDSSSEIISSTSPKFGVEGNDSFSSKNTLKSLHVARTKDWIEKTSTHVNKLLCATFPKVCYLFKHCYLVPFLFQAAMTTVVILFPGLLFMFLDMRSSSKKGETRTFVSHTGTIVEVQSDSEEKQTDAFGELEIRIGAITISCLVIS